MKWREWNCTAGKEDPKEEDQNKKKGFESPPTPPPYAPSEYELKRAANIKRIEEHTKPLFLTEGTEVVTCFN